MSKERAEKYSQIKWKYGGTLSATNPSVTIVSPEGLGAMVFLRTNLSRATYWESYFYPRVPQVVAIANAVISRSGMTFSVTNDGGNYFDIFYSTDFTSE